jgi:hypothetical protein
MTSQSTAQQLTQRRLRTALVGLAAFAMILAACSSSNLGAHTSCSTFQSLSSPDRLKAVTNMQKSRGDNSGPMLTNFSVTAFCALNPGRTIDGIYTG